MMSAMKVTFNDNEKYCRWKGVLMSPDNCRKLFGTDDFEILIDSKGFAMIGSTLYCSNMMLLVNDLKYIIKNAAPIRDLYGTGLKPVIMPEDLSFVARIKRIKPYDLLKEFNMRKIRAFNKDLDEYYGCITNNV